MPNYCFCSMVAACYFLVPGFIRNIDVEKKAFIILTPVPYEQLIDVNALLKGNVDMPLELFQTVSSHSLKVSINLSSTMSYVICHMFCPVLSCHILSYPILSNPILSYPILSYPILSYPIQSYPILSYRILSYPIQSYPILSHPIQSYPIQSYPIQSYPILSYPILSYPILSYPILSYPILSYPILSYPIIFSPILIGPAFPCPILFYHIMSFYLFQGILSSERLYSTPEMRSHIRGTRARKPRYNLKRRKFDSPSVTA